MEVQKLSPRTKTLTLDSSRAPGSAATAPAVEEQPREERFEAGKVKEIKPEGGMESTGTATSTATTATVAAGVDTDLQKKVRRAERFGVPVKLSEQEKRNSRAERFGNGPSSRGTSNGKAEEEKRKARAERFGLAAQTATEEEAKKKARLDRFAPNKTPDTLEEEKRKARAARFSQASTASSATNGQADPEMTTVDQIDGGT